MKPGTTTTIIAAGQKDPELVAALAATESSTLGHLFTSEDTRAAYDDLRYTIANELHVGASIAEWRRSRRPHLGGSVENQDQEYIDNLAKSIASGTGLGTAVDEKVIKALAELDFGNLKFAATQRANIRETALG